MLLFRPFIYIREINKKLFSSRIRYAKCETITKFQVAWGEERCCRVNESVHQCQTPELFFFCFTRALLSFESLEGAMEDNIKKNVYATWNTLTIFLHPADPIFAFLFWSCTLNIPSLNIIRVKRNWHISLYIHSVSCKFFALLAFFIPP